MNESDFPQEPAGVRLCGDEASNDDVPQFGALDIVEAFTAMRHELRAQTKESRELAAQIEAAVSNIHSLESKLLGCIDDNRSDDSGEAKQLVLIIVETDHQLLRALTAIKQWEMTRRLRQEADAKAVVRYFDGMGWLGRRFARPLLEFVAALRPLDGPIMEDPAIQGMNLVVERLSRVMQEHEIERSDVEGQPFDANTMRAIGTVESTNCPAGHVAEQLSPTYYWRGELLRFANVRVAK
jgi:hypothetical protein